VNVSAVIVTRGDVDLSPVLDSLPRDWQKVVWDNSQRQDCSVFGRYAAIPECEHELIYVQDDDCVLADPAALVEAWAVPSWGRSDYIACNMPPQFREHYSDSALVGFGAVFTRSLPARAFNRFYRAAGNGDISYGLASFKRECDTVFTTLMPRILVDLPYTDLPWASAPNRLWKQPEHVSERRAMLDLARKVRDA
jgi:hypothetical protein